MLRWNVEAVNPAVGVSNENLDRLALYVRLSSLTPAATSQGVPGSKACLWVGSILWTAAASEARRRFGLDGKAGNLIQSPCWRGESKRRRRAGPPSHALPAQSKGSPACASKMSNLQRQARKPGLQGRSSSPSTITHNQASSRIHFSSPIRRNRSWNRGSERRGSTVGVTLR